MIITSGFCGLRLCCFHLSRQTIPFSPVAGRKKLFRTTFNISQSKKNEKEKVIVISGPTGAGKSRLALEVAKRLNGEIISADSVQVYRGLDVGSAKPSSSDRKEVPHHLIDIVYPSEDYSVGQFFDDARRATKEVLDRGHVPVVTGGTGLYLRWFMYGKPDVPKSSPAVSSEVDAEISNLQRNNDWEAAVELVVKAGDPKAQLIAVNDWYRLRRSLEIVKSSGSPPSAFAVPYDSFRGISDAVDENASSLPAVSQHDASPKELDYEFICFFLSTPRVDLYRSIDFRCEAMLSGGDGLLSEAQWLLEIGLLPNSNSATRAIGYRQAMEYLLKCQEQRGLSSPRDFYAFLSEFQKASRNFAKRQMTWFRHEQIYQWLNASRPMDRVVEYICSAYQDDSGMLAVPESLRMNREMRNQREASELKAYRPQNRCFIRREDCSDILDWIRRKQGCCQDEVVPLI